MTANDLLEMMQKMFSDQLFDQVKEKCSQFLVNKHKKLQQNIQKKNGQLINAEKVVTEVKELVDKQQRLI